MEHMTYTRGLKYDFLVLPVNASVQNNLECTGCDLVKSFLFVCSFCFDFLSFQKCMTFSTQNVK